MDTWTHVQQGLTCRKEGTAQIPMIPSLDPEASCCPLGENAVEVTASVCSNSVALGGLPGGAVRSHTMTR